DRCRRCVRRRVPRLARLRACARGRGPPGHRGRRRSAAMRAIAQTDYGAFAVDLETEEIDPAGPVEVSGSEPLTLSLPRVVASASVGSTIVAVVDRKPPLMVSHDAGVTWRESGGGLPPGNAVAIADDNPDLIGYASP